MKKDNNEIINRRSSISHLAIAFLLILSCIGLSSCNGSGDRGSLGIDIFTGTEGIALEIARDTPPRSVLENQAFPLGITLENKGAFDVEGGYISIIKEDDYIDIDHWTDFNALTTRLGTFSIEGKAQDRPRGERQFGVIQMQAKELEPMKETHTVFFGVNICYRYMTFFGATVCIDQDIYETKEIKKACEIRDLSFSGQGAPIAVRDVSTTMISRGGNQLVPRFSMTIRNVGKGEVIAYDKIRDACTSGSLSRQDFSYITIKHAYVGNYELDCEPNPIRLYDGEAKIYCEPRDNMFSQALNYHTNLKLELDYGYTQNVATNTEIRKFPR